MLEEPETLTFGVTCGLYVKGPRDGFNTWVESRIPRGWLKVGFLSINFSLIQNLATKLDLTLSYILTQYIFIRGEF